MAKVKFPLHSLSASGSLGGQITFNKVAEQPARTIIRTIDGEQITAEYPARIIGGRGIAKMKIQRRRDIPKRKALSNDKAFPTQADTERLLAVSAMLSSWMVRHKISISRSMPTGRGSDTAPAHHGYLLGRGENREIRRFPGQPEKSTLSIRRDITSPKSGYTHLIHLLLTANYSRFLITARHWDGVGRNTLHKWRPRGDAPWEELPESLYLPTIGVVNRAFLNIWLQLSYLVPRFELIKDWFPRGQQNLLWVNPTYTEEQNPNYNAYLQFINSDNDSTAIQQQPWVPRPR